MVSGAPVSEEMDYTGKDSVPAVLELIAQHSHSLDLQLSIKGGSHMQPSDIHG